MTSDCSMKWDGFNAPAASAKKHVTNDPFRLDYVVDGEREPLVAPAPLTECRNRSSRQAKMLVVFPASNGRLAFTRKEPALVAGVHSALSAGCVAVDG